jgi:hypothetical protein
MDALWLAFVQWLHTAGLHVDAGTARDVAEGAARATAALDMPSLLALAAALGWASGFRLYAVVFLVGMMGVAGWIALPPGLAVLQSPVVLIASGCMLLVEFFADKVPWLDSAWDAVHAFIRVPAGAVLAAGVFGADNAAMAVAAGLLGGSLSATALATARAVFQLGAVVLRGRPRRGRGLAGHAAPAGLWHGPGGDGGRVRAADGGALQVPACRGAAPFLFLFCFCQGGVNVQKNPDCEPWRDRLPCRRDRAPHGRQDRRRLFRCRCAGQACGGVR